ncbi:MAG: alkaline phosphatase family protein [Candidatus Hydrogenedentes bacterium]|nr:alkaline phosphatase family protein [Candidatus Hydrogenedentota bacterium]
MKRILLLILFGLMTALPTAVWAQAPGLIAGPMIGHVTESTALVWFYQNNGVDVWGEAFQSGHRLQGIRDGLTLRFADLQPDQPLRVQIHVGDRDGAWETEELLFRTAPVPTETGKLRLAFGSCSKDSLHPYVPVMEAMAFEQPDLALFVGDNSYFVVGDGNWSTSGPKGDWNSSEQMLARHLRTRTNPYFQRLFRSVPGYGIWDDHDYGPNNTDRTFPMKDAALDVFKYVWANPGYGTPETPGIFSTFRRGPAQIFLMDDRYHKWVKTEEHPEVSSSEATIWGEGQFAWLLDELKRSKAPVKIIANGTQVISNDGRGEGHANEAPEELGKLLAFLRENRIGGVIFLSGDRHFTEVCRLQQEGGPDLLEFTSSPIQQDRPVGPMAEPRNHPTHVWSANGNSYGLVTIDAAPDGQGFVRFEMRDANNHVPVINEQAAQSEFPLSSLYYPKP